MIQVYDIHKKAFKNIDLNTQEQDFILFDRTAITIVKKYYNICGYFYLDKINRHIHFIDFDDNILVIPQSSFCSMIDICKAELETYNIAEGINYKPSLAFLCLCYEEKPYDSYDYFTNLCFDIMCNSVLLNDFAAINDSIIYPTSVQELYEFAQNVYKITNFDYISPDYDKTFKYIVDGLINGYHIALSYNDVKKYAYNISLLALEKLEEYYE